MSFILLFYSILVDLLCMGWMN